MLGEGSGHRLDAQVVHQRCHNGQIRFDGTQSARMRPRCTGGAAPSAGRRRMAGRGYPVPCPASPSSATSTRRRSARTCDVGDGETGGREPRSANEGLSYPAAHCCTCLPRLACCRTWFGLGVSGRVACSSPSRAGPSRHLACSGLAVPTACFRCSGERDPQPQRFCKRTREAPPSPGAARRSRESRRRCLSRPTLRRYQPVGLGVCVRARARDWCASACVRACVRARVVIGRVLTQWAPSGSETKAH